MKLRNKRLAAGILAVVFAAAMPASAFAAETEEAVSATDTTAYTAEDLKNDISDAVTAFVNGDTETVKSYFDSTSDYVKDSAGITEEDEAEISAEINAGVETATEITEKLGALAPETEDTTDEAVAEEAADTTTDEEASTEESKKIVWVDGIWDLNLETHPGYNVELPEQLLVTYADGTKGYANVTWTEHDDVTPVDATTHNTIFEGTDSEWGFFLIHAHVEGYGRIIGVKVRITAKAPIPEEPEEPDEPVVPDEPTEPTEPEDTNKPSGDLNTSETIENVQTGENDLTMVWVLFMFSASAMAVGFTSRKFRRA